MSIKPYNTDKTKKEEVAEMFDNISPKYDFLNRFLSMGIDISWRKKTVKKVKESGAKYVLDAATGTGDLAIMMAQNGIPRIVGTDISKGMLEVGKNKVAKAGLQESVSLQIADGENLPFPENSFDAITIAFGIRNFENVEKGLESFYKVLKPGAHLYILEFSKPDTFPVKQAYHFYFTYILPLWGKMVSKDAKAYTYLPESVKAFPDGKAFLDLMQKAGFKECTQSKLSFGISSIYQAKK